MGNNFDEAITELNHFICLDDALSEIGKITGLNTQKNAELLLNFIRDEKRPENHTQGEFGLRVFFRNKIYGWTETIGHKKASAWCELTDLAFDGARQRRLPGEIGFCRDELFLFLRERGLEIGGHADEPESGPIAARNDAPKGVEKRWVMAAFDGMGFSADRWNDMLADPPKWLEGCRTERGSSKLRKSSLWNPVLIAVELHDRKRASLKELDSAFSYTLKDWKEWWAEASDGIRHQDD